MTVTKTVNSLGIFVREILMEGSVFVPTLNSRRMTESREKIILNPELKTKSD